MSNLALSTSSRVEKQTTISIDLLPPEIVLHIFGFLSPEDLGRACRVCKLWQECASDDSLWDKFDLKALYPGFNVIDEKVWAKFVNLEAFELDATGAPHINKRILTLVVRHLSRRVEGKAGVTVLTIPKGLTLEKLIKIAALPKQGNAVPLGVILPQISEQIGNIPVNKTYVVVITNSLFEKSINCSFDKQKELVNSSGYEMPEVLQAAALCVLTYISSLEQRPICFYTIYTRCLEKFTSCAEELNDLHWSVGDFSTHHTSLNIHNEAPGHQELGSAALRKFCND